MNRLQQIMLASFCAGVTVAVLERVVPKWHEVAQGLVGITAIVALLFIIATDRR